MKFFETKWRIVIDSYAGYEVQYRYWWMPFWVQHNFCNTFFTIESAKKYIERAKRPVVWQS